MHTVAAQFAEGSCGDSRPRLSVERSSTISLSPRRTERGPSQPEGGLPNL